MKYYKISYIDDPLNKGKIERIKCDYSEKYLKNNPEILMISFAKEHIFEMLSEGDFLFEIIPGNNIIEKNGIFYTDDVKSHIYIGSVSQNIINLIKEGAILKYEGNLAAIIGREGTYNDLLFLYEKINNKNEFLQIIAKNAASNGNINILSKIYSELSMGLLNECLNEAASNSQMEVVNFLISCGAKDLNGDALVGACLCGNINIAKKLIDNGSKINDLALEVSKRNEHIYEYLKKEASK